MSRLSNVVYISLFVALIAHRIFDPENVLFYPIPHAGVWATVIIFAFSAAFYLLHDRDINRKEREKKRLQKQLQNSLERLDESYQYIGEVNRKLPLLKTLTTDLLNQIKSGGKKEAVFERLLALAVVSILKKDWGVLRFVNKVNKNTHWEYCFQKNGENNIIPKVGNSDLVEILSHEKNYKVIKEFYCLNTSDENTDIQCFLIFPSKQKRSDQVFRDNYNLLQSIIDQAQLFYKYFNSRL